MNDEGAPPPTYTATSTIWLLMAAALGAYSLFGAWRSQSRARTELPVGSVAPHIELDDTKGRTTTVGPRPGRVVVLDFWATWCAPCRRALPHWESLHQNTRDQPVDILLVNQDEEGGNRKRLVLDMLREYGVQAPVALDNGQASWAYRVEKLPYTVIIDSAGKIAHRWTGAGDIREISRLIDTLVKPLNAAPVPRDAGISQTEPD